jgi:Lrp/AsnC family leucine-responsive transcriptional regulator
MSKSAPNPVLDEIDQRILDALQVDGGLSNLEVAERVGLSPSACSRRVQALEDQGVVMGRVALLDRRKIGLSLTAIIQIAMDRHTPERFASFEKKVRACPERSRASTGSAACARAS